MGRIHFTINKTAPDIPRFFNEKSESAAVVILAIYVLFLISVTKYNVAGVLTYASLPLMIAVASRIQIAPILKKILFISPFILMVAVANPFLDKKEIGSFAGIPFTGGMISGAVIVLKSSIIIFTLLVFSSLIPFYRFCEILRTFKVPDVFITQLLLLYRYSFLLADEALAIQKARNMRSFGKKGKDIITTAKLIGSLLIRTSSKADRIYRAMVARGFDGTLIRNHKVVFGIQGWFLVIGALCIFLIIKIVFR
jgi:cobalt/nickel transport system permease protein